MDSDDELRPDNSNAPSHLLYEEIADRFDSIDRVIGSQRLSGQEIDPLTLADMRLHALGKISLDEVKARLRRRIASGYFNAS